MAMSLLLYDRRMVYGGLPFPGKIKGSSGTSSGCRLKLPEESVEEKNREDSRLPHFIRLVRLMRFGRTSSEKTS